MKTQIFTALVIVAASACFTSCDKPSATPPTGPQQSVAPPTVPTQSAPRPTIPTQTTGPKIEGIVFRDIYPNFGDRNVSPISYEVTVTLTNVTTTQFEYDTVEGAFLPESGTPLSNQTHPYDESKKTDPSAYTGPDFKSATVAPGSSTDFHFTTDGYTGKLLEDAGDAPLRFGFTVAHRRKIVFGPLVADLPPLNGLPLKKRDSNGVVLEFKKTEAGKIYDKTQPRR